MVQNGCKRSSPILLLRQKLGKKLCKGLPAFHALTGCDTTSAIAGVGKKKPGRFYDVVKHTKKASNGRAVTYSQRRMQS